MIFHKKRIKLLFIGLISFILCCTCGVMLLTHNNVSADGSETYYLYRPSDAGATVTCGKPDSFVYGTITTLNSQNSAFVYTGCTTYPSFIYIGTYNGHNIGTGLVLFDNGGISDVSQVESISLTFEYGGLTDSRTSLISGEFVDIFGVRKDIIEDKDVYTPINNNIVKLNDK